MILTSISPIDCRIRTFVWRTQAPPTRLTIIPAPSILGKFRVVHNEIIPQRMTIRNTPVATEPCLNARFWSSLLSLLYFAISATTFSYFRSFWKTPLSSSSLCACCGKIIGSAWSRRLDEVNVNSWDSSGVVEVDSSGWGSVVEVDSSGPVEVDSSGPVEAVGVDSCNYGGVIEIESSGWGGVVEVVSWEWGGSVRVQAWDWGGEAEAEAQDCLDCLASYDLGPLYSNSGNP